MNELPGTSVHCPFGNRHCAPDATLTFTVISTGGSTCGPASTIGAALPTLCTICGSGPASITGTTCSVGGFSTFTVVVFGPLPVCGTWTSGAGGASGGGGFV